MDLFQIIYQNTVCTSQKTHYLSATKANLLILFREIIAVYCENHMLKQIVHSVVNSPLIVFQITHSFLQPIVQLLKNFPSIYGTLRFITVFIRALHWSLSTARSSIPLHPISLGFILILFPTYVLVFLVVSFLLPFPPVSYMHSSSPNSCYISCPSHPP